MPSFECQATKAIIRFNHLFTLWGHTPIGYQRFHLDFLGGLAPRARGVESHTCDANGVNAEWLVPKDSGNDTAILYLHGGGYVLGSIKSHRAFVGTIAAAAQSPTFIINYRLAPEWPFPAALEDAVASYKWLLAEGFTPENIVIAGDSAGGGLSVATLISLRDSHDPLPAGAMLISPWTDLALDGDSIDALARKDPMLTRYQLATTAQMYLGGTDASNPLVSPIHGDLTGLPPLCIHVGTCERLLDDSRRLAERAREDGVEVELEIWDGMFHVWHSMTLMPESRAAVRKLGEFFESVTGSAAVGMSP
ncbi:MAG: hypothetical protein A2W01_02810 [Candidatus Solincola sediminis]|uniref:Alpha/beta hydrolase fold-3 domain-containing protein n=1 Tax=Candidatus Solincola sediminis TaxID=1797199 RepID=A0A1F2WTM7_9ACTN|nr:MAG: hypothetical protein A2W01_02810 [Candidatus Solincola sediminis]OFW60086.1 MAG: hypothetical protein A2Y75_02020 [Candidatus Solincola sediminis]